MAFSKITGKSIDVSTESIAEFNSTGIDDNATSTAITIAANNSVSIPSLYGNITTADNLTVGGDFIVQGNNFTIDADSLRVEDSLIQLASNNETSDVIDIGFFGHYSNDGNTALHTGFFRDASDEQYYLFNGLEDANLDANTSVTTINRSGTGFTLAALNISNLNITNDPFPRITLSDSGGTNQKMLLDVSAGYSSVTAWNNTSHGTLDFKSYDGTTTRLNMRIDSNGKIFMNEGVPFSWTDSSQNVAAEIYGDSSDNLVFRNTSAKIERMRIDSSGNVIVQDGGELRAVRSGQTNYSAIFTDTGDKTIINNSWANNKLVLDRDGNVGIGTTTPTNTLHVHTPAGGPQIRVTNTNTGQTSTDGFHIGTDASSGAYLNQNEAQPMYFYVNGSERMQIASDGRVTLKNRVDFDDILIGTTAGKYIQVSGSGGTAWTMSSSGGGSTPTPGTASTEFGFHHWNGSAWSQPLRIEGSSDVKILGNAGRLTRQYSILNTGGSSLWVRLGTAYFNQDGQSLYIKLVTNAGYNATNTQDAESFIRFKTGNGGSYVAGDGSSGNFYANGRFVRHGNGGSPSFVRAVQISTTTYEIWVLVSTFTGGGSFYEVSWGQNGTWTHSGSYTTTSSPPGVGSGYAYKDFTYTGGSTTSGSLILPDNEAIYFGSSVLAANRLDDYEEGTWTPALTGSTGAPSINYGYRSGFYIKVGNKVTARWGMQISVKSGGSGTAEITGLPFTGKYYGAYQQPFALTNTQGLVNDADGPAVFFLVDSTAKMQGRLFTNTDTALPISDFQGNSWCIGTLTYDVT